MTIPAWIVRLEHKATRDQGLSIWADLQRAREKAQLEYEQIAREANRLFEGTIGDATVIRNCAIENARCAYERSKTELLKNKPKEGSDG